MFRDFRNIREAQASVYELSGWTVKSLSAVGRPQKLLPYCGKTFRVPLIDKTGYIVPNTQLDAVENISSIQFARFLFKKTVKKFLHRAAGITNKRHKVGDKIVGEAALLTLFNPTVHHRLTNCLRHCPEQFVKLVFYYKKRLSCIDEIYYGQAYRCWFNDTALWPQNQQPKWFVEKRKQIKVSGSEIEKFSTRISTFYQL